MEEAAETRACELDAYQAMAGVRVAHVDYTTLGCEVHFLFFAAGSEMGLRDPDFEVGADRHVKTGDECGAAPAEIFAGGFFFKIGAAGVTASDLEGQADGDSAFRSRFRGRRGAADLLKHAPGPPKPLRRRAAGRIVLRCPALLAAS